MSKPPPTISTAAIASGDLLAWAHDPYSTFTDLTLAMIRRVTSSPYGHVGIAWRCHDGIDDELFVVEATMPKIRMARVTTDRPFYCLPMKIDWTERNKAFLLSKLDYPYGLVDACRAGLGMRVNHDMKWQCAELAHGFFEASGILLKPEYTPGKLVENACQYVGGSMHKVVGPGRTLEW